jgi:hypothetical protein
MRVFFQQLCHNERFLTSCHFVLDYTYSFATAAIYSWQSINVLLTHSLCRSSIGEESPHSGMYCSHDLCCSLKGGPGERLVWHALCMLRSVMSSNITFLHCMHNMRRVYMQQQNKSGHAEYFFMRFQVLTVASMKMTVFWDVAPCSLVEVYQCFRGACCLTHRGALTMEAASASETSVNFYQTTWHNIPEASHLQNIFWLVNMYSNAPVHKQSCNALIQNHRCHGNWCGQ